MKLLLEISCFTFFCVTSLYGYAGYTENYKMTRKLDNLYNGVAWHINGVQERAEARIHLQREKVDL